MASKSNLKDLEIIKFKRPDENENNLYISNIPVIHDTAFSDQLRGPYVRMTICK